MARTMASCRRVAVVLVLASLATADASAQMTFKTTTVAPWSYTTIKVPAGEPVLFVAMQPLDLKLEQYQLCENTKPNGYLAIFATGPPGGTIYVDAVRNGPEGGLPKHVRLKVLVREGGPSPGPGPPPPPGPSPGPTPGPQPQLKGLAKQIYELAQPIGDPAMAHKIGGAYSAVASVIAAGGIGTITDARAAITEQMKGLGALDAKWKPVGDMARKALNQFGQSLDGAKVTMAAIGKGLEAVR